MSAGTMIEANKDAASGRLDLSSNLSELERVSAFARSIGAAEGLSSEAMFSLELCLEEAVANIIMHGSVQDDSALRIAVSLLQGTPALTVCIEDNGSPFDPTRVPDPAPVTTLEDAPLGGMGIPLIRKLASAMRYEHKDGRNRLFLTFGPCLD